MTRRSFQSGFLFATLVGVLAIGLTGCDRGRGDGSERDLNAPLRVVVSIPPLQGLVAELLPDDAQLTVLIPPGNSPHGFVPVPSSSIAVKQADLIVLVGMGLEGPTQRMIDRHAAGRVVSFARTVGEDHASADHDHELCAVTGHEHATDPHLWLDAALVERLIVVVAAELGELGVVDASERAAALIERVRDADAQAQHRLGPVEGARMITQHDAWRRFAPRYGLEVLSSVVPSGVGEPTPGDMSRAHEAVRLARTASDAPIGIFTEPQLDPRPAERLARVLNLPLGTLDPLGDGDWFALLERNTQALLATLGASPDATGAGEAGTPAP